MLRKCAYCKHCKGKTDYYEDTPEPFNCILNFYCLKKDNKFLGSMIKKENEIEYLPCFEKQEEQAWL